MAQFQEYTAAKTEEQREEFLQRQMEKKLDLNRNAGGEFGPSAAEYLDQLKERKKTTTFAERTKYYFLDCGVMEAKAARYRALANDGTDIEAYAARYSNHSAGKRKKAALAAADAFEKAAELEDLYQDQTGVDSLTKLAQKRAIMEARLLGMKKAAEVKSTSKENEAYRVAKAEISCYSVLKEQAQELIKAAQNEKTKEDLRKELRGIMKELSKAEKEMRRVLPDGAARWHSLFTEDKAEAAFAQAKEINEDITKEDVKVLLKMQALTSEIGRPEYEEALHAVEKNQLYPGYKYKEQSLSRWLSFGLRTVLRDQNGLPIDKKALENEQHNKQWLKALKEGDVEAKNKILMDQIHYIEDLRIPSPREVQERGVDFFFQKDPALFYDIWNLGLTHDNIFEDVNDPFLVNYGKEHPEFAQKVTAMSMLGSIFTFNLKLNHLVNQNTVENTLKYELEEMVPEQIESTFQLFKENYENAYGDAYDQGLRGEVLVHLDEKEREALKLFTSKYRDTYDSRMRDQINEGAESELGQNLLKKKSEEDLSELTGEAYRTLFGSTISKSKKLQRAEGAIDKKKLQMALRNRMENFLAERQIAQAKALSRELYKKNRDGVEVINEKMKGRLEKKEDLDEAALNFAKEWTDLEKEPKLLSWTDRESVDVHVTSKIRKAAEILGSLDLSVFSYQSDADFVAGIQDNYGWVRKAEALRIYYEKAKEVAPLKNTDSLPISTLEARLRFFAEMKEDYDARIAMMNSPYYALLANSDISGLSDRKLQEKITGLQGTDMELASFLKNYRALKNRRGAFQKGKDAGSRYEEILSERQEEEARKQEEMWNKIEELHLDALDNMSEEDYQKRIADNLMEHAKQAVPEVNGALVRSKVPILNTTNGMGNLKGQEVLALENWLEDILTETKLQEKGFTGNEISELLALRKKSYQARWLVEVNEYFEKMGKYWDVKYIETPRMNPKIDEGTSLLLQQFCRNRDKVGSIGLEDKKAIPEEGYHDALAAIVSKLAPKNIFFTKNHEQVMAKARQKAEKELEKEKTEKKDAVVHIGGKEYHVHSSLKQTLAKYEGKTLPEESRAALEEKLVQLNDLALKLRTIRIIDTEVKAGVFTTEFKALAKVYGNEILAINNEIDGLLSAGQQQNQQNQQQNQQNNQQENLQTNQQQNQQNEQQILQNQQQNEQQNQKKEQPEKEVKKTYIQQWKEAISALANQDAVQIKFYTQAGKQTQKYVVDKDQDIAVMKELKENWQKLRDYEGGIPLYENGDAEYYEKLCKNIAKVFGMDYRADREKYLKLAVKRYRIEENMAATLFSSAFGYATPVKEALRK